MRIDVVVVGSVWAVLGVCSAAAGQMRIVEKDEGYQFYERDMPLLFYRTVAKATKDGTHARSNYCHPVYGLDGEVLTEDFPVDHLHHRGIFWAWHQVTIGQEAMSDMWACQDFAWDIPSVRVLPPQPDSAALKAEVYWKSSLWQEGREPFAREHVTIRVGRNVANTRRIDFDIEILALVEGLRLGGSNDVKGYGGFSTRIVLPNDLRMSDANGAVKPRNTALPAGDWMNFAGTFGNTASNFAILVHPSHPDRPRKWILRRAGSAQNVAYPGRAPIAVSMKIPLVLRYRLVLHKDADLKQLFQAYSEKP